MFYCCCSWRAWFYCCCCWRPSFYCCSCCWCLCFIAAAASTDVFIAVGGDHFFVAAAAGAHVFSVSTDIHVFLVLLPLLSPMYSLLLLLPEPMFSLLPLLLLAPMFYCFCCCLPCFYCCCWRPCLCYCCWRSVCITATAAGTYVFIAAAAVAHILIAAAASCAHIFITTVADGAYVCITAAAAGADVLIAAAGTHVFFIAADAGAHVLLLLLPPRFWCCCFSCRGSFLPFVFLHLSSSPVLYFFINKLNKPFNSEYSVAYPDRYTREYGFKSQRTKRYDKYKDEDNCLNKIVQIMINHHPRNSDRYINFVYSCNIRIMKIWNRRVGWFIHRTPVFIIYDIQKMNMHL